MSDVPVSDKGWNDLPTELKIMCIKKMDSVTRMNLRRVSPLDEQLVDSQRVTVRRLSVITYEHEPQRIRATFLAPCMTTSYFRVTSKSTRTICPTIQYLLEHGDIRKMEVHNVDCSSVQAKLLTDTLTRISMANPFRIKKLVMEKFRKEYLSFIENCAGLQVVRLSCKEDDRITFRKFLPAIFNVKNIELYDLRYTGAHAYIQLIQNWLDNNKQIDSEVYVSHSTQSARMYDFIEEIVDEFEKIIIRRGEIENSEFVRLKTSDPKKHILVQVDVYSRQILIEMIDETENDPCDYSDDSEDLII